MKEMTLGDLHLAPTGRTVPVMGESATKTADLRGRAEFFSVRSAAWEMTIAPNRWDNGGQEIVLHDRRTAPQRFDRFRSARRLGLTPAGAGESSVEFMQAQMGENDHPTCRITGFRDLVLLLGPASCGVLGCRAHGPGKCHCHAS